MVLYNNIDIEYFLALTATSPTGLGLLVGNRLRPCEGDYTRVGAMPKKSHDQAAAGPPGAPIITEDKKAKADARRGARADDALKEQVLMKLHMQTRPANPSVGAFGTCRVIAGMYCSSGPLVWSSLRLEQIARLRCNVEYMPLPRCVVVSYHKYHTEK